MEFNPNATVEPTTAAWDFNYSGQFQSDPSAAGNLARPTSPPPPEPTSSPSSCRDSAGAVSTDTLYVSVTDPRHGLGRAGRNRRRGDAADLRRHGDDALGSS